MELRFYGRHFAIKAILLTRGSFVFTVPPLCFSHVYFYLPAFNALIGQLSSPVRHSGCVGLSGTCAEKTIPTAQDMQVPLPDPTHTLFLGLFNAVPAGRTTFATYFCKPNPTFSSILCQKFCSYRNCTQLSASLHA